MKIFIFERLEQVSDNYHPEGGLVVVAEDEEHVKELITRGGSDIEITEDEWGDVIVYELENDIEPRLFVFPDTGCC